ncbi:hypothetical protein [Microcoleus sp. Pol12B4]|uniref:hypothetical protein n=1 Tax=Microcoleus sp. Pol12B4 TaxID=3055395 RepID=UPI002FD70E6E
MCLFRAELCGVYASLNQGIADKKNKLGLGKPSDMVRVQAQLFKYKLGSDKLREFLQPLDLQLDYYIPQATTFRWFCKFVTNGLLLLKGLFEQLNPTTILETGVFDREPVSQWEDRENHLTRGCRSPDAIVLMIKVYYGI